MEIFKTSVHTISRLTRFRRSNIRQLSSVFRITTLLTLVAILGCKPAFAAELPPTTEMYQKYVESDKRSVKYFGEAEIDKYQVVLRDGNFYDANGQLASYFFEQNFVVDKLGRTFVIGIAGAGLNHSAPARGEPVVFAGEVRLKKGKITALSNASGHYKPSIYVFYRYLRYLELLGIDISKIEIYVTEDKARRTRVINEGTALEFMAKVEAQMKANVPVTDGSKLTATSKACAAQF